MSEILQTNIFFLITSVAVVSLTILVGFALFYVVSILRNVRDISNKVKKGSDVLGKDLSELHTAIKKNGSKTKSAFNFFAGKFASRKKRSAKKEK